MNFYWTPLTKDYQVSAKLERLQFIFTSKASSTLENRKYPINWMLFECAAADFRFGSPAPRRSVIVKNLYAKVGSLCKLDDPSWLTQDVTFTKYVERMKLCYKDTETEKIGKIEVLVDAGEKQEQKT